MMIWLPIAAMTAVAVLAVLWPLARRGKDLRAGNDVAVYRDQLEEIDRDQAVGAIAPAEADAARVEVSRRLLAADAADVAAQRQTPAPDGSSRRRRAVAVGALFALPAGALAFYLAFGSPDLPGQPLASRVAQAHQGQSDGQASAQSVAEMFARVERHLEEHPDDGRGWEVVAPIYLRLGRYDDAVKARRNALQFLGETAERQADLGEALMMRGNGVVTDDAKAAFDRALVVDPKNITARFYGGLAAEQDGRKDAAARLWRALLADAPAGAPWIEAVQRALARVDGAAAAAPAPPQAGPQADMIRAMVERLAARMKEDGSDPEGWLRLVRSYAVLRDAARAEAATADARRALAGDAGKLARLEEGLRDIAAGVPPSAAVAPTPAVAAAPQATPQTTPPAAAGADEAQDAMIRGMVARLAARLHDDGSDVDGWLRLMRSYVVLGEAAKARAAVDDARRALKDDADKLRRLDEGAKSLGVGG